MSVVLGHKTLVYVIRFCDFMIPISEMSAILVDTLSRKPDEDPEPRKSRRAPLHFDCHVFLLLEVNQFLRPGAPGGDAEAGAPELRL